MSWIFVLFIFGEALFFGTISLLSIDYNSVGSLYSYFNIFLVMLIACALLLKIFKKKSFDKIQVYKIHLAIIFIVLGILLSIVYGFSIFSDEIMINFLKFFFAFTIPAVTLAFITSKNDLVNAYSHLFYINLYLTVCFTVALLADISTGMFHSLGGATHLLIGYTMSLLLGYNLLQFIHKNYLLSKILYLILVSFNIFVIIISGSRGALVSGVLIFLFIFLKYFLQKRNLKLIILIIIMLSLLFNFVKQLSNFDFAIARTLAIFSLESDQSSMSRINLFERAIALFYDKPLLGNTVGGYSNDFGRYYYPHNIILDIISGFGLLGLIIFLISMFLVVKNIRFILQMDFKLHFIIFVFLNSLGQLMFSNTYIINSQFWLSTIVIILFVTDYKKNYQT